MTEVSHPEPSASFRPGRVVCGCDCPSRCTCFDSYGRDFVDRFLGFSRQFDPFVNFGSAFLTVLPLLLGYYHLARLGVLVGLAVSAVMFWANSNLCVLRIRHSTGGSFSDVARGCICGRLATAYDDGSMGAHEGIQFPRNPECTAIAAPSTSAQIPQLT